MKPVGYCLAFCLLFPVYSSAGADDRQVVIDAYMRAYQHESYRLELRDTDGGGQSAIVDVQMPDRLHVRSAQGEFIVHPSGTWARQGGTWSKLRENMTPMMAAYRPPTREQAERDIGAVAFVMEETVEGCPSRTYRYQSDSEAFGAGPSGEDVILSICQETGLPIRAQPLNATASLIYDFSTRVDIRPPD